MPICSHAPVATFQIGREGIEKVKLQVYHHYTLLQRASKRDAVRPARGRCDEVNIIILASLCLEHHYLGFTVFYFFLGVPIDVSCC